MGTSFTKEKNKLNPLGSVFTYEDGTEFKLDKLDKETDEEYQARFKEELGKELDRLALPKNKKKTYERESIMNKCTVSILSRNTEQEDTFLLIFFLMKLVRLLNND